MSAPKILPAAAYALSDLAGTVQSVYLHHNAAMDAVGRARGGVVEDLVTRSQVQALELEVARLRDRENITSGELITGDELASGMQALRARLAEIELAEIELAEELAEDIIEAQRAVVQQLASQTTCDWPGKCRHQRPASAAAPEPEPTGWKVAPVDPTPEMIDAAESTNWRDDDTRGSVINMWHCMLAAAPDHAEDARGMVSERTEPADGCGACGDMQKNIQYLEGLRQGWSTHAADLAQRAADLEALVAELRRERDELREQADFVERHLGIISGVLGSAEPIEIDDIAARLTAEVAALRRARADLAAKCDELLVALHSVGSTIGIAEADRSPYSITCGVLAMASRLAEIERAEPVAWIEHELQGTGLRHLHFERRPNTLRDDVVAPVWTALIARPAQAAAPERAEPEDPRTPPPGCRLLGDYEPAQAGDMAYIGAIAGRWRRVKPRMGVIGATMDELSDGARVLALARPCRCGPDGCSDSVACPKGGAA